MKLFTLFYFTLALALYALALPLLLVLSFKSKYRRSIPARFFLWRNPRFTCKGIWFHACSLGEVRSLAPLIEAIGSENVMISTITHTGYAEAQKYGCEVRYLPFEMFLPFWIKRPKMVVVLEAEFWYLLFHIAKARGAKVVLLNARISERSFAKYLRFGWFYRKLLEYCDAIYVQSEADKNRFVALEALHVKVLGNIKLAQKIELSRSYEKPKREVITAASTHEGEEQAIVEAFMVYRQTHSESMLIIAPRHPERFSAVWDSLTCNTFTPQGHFFQGACKRWSDKEGFDADIVLLDTLGELNNIYAISDVVILGGAFNENVGGHNPLEPAHFGCKIISGVHFFNQKELFKYVHHVQFVERDAIGAALRKTHELPPSMIDEKIDLSEIINDMKAVLP